MYSRTVGWQTRKKVMGQPSARERLAQVELAGTTNYESSVTYEGREGTAQTSGEQDHGRHGEPKSINPADAYI